MAFAFLKNWFARKPRQRPDLVFLLYTRAACPLCDEAKELLTRYQKQYGFTLETKDVEESAELVREHGECVPVVTVDRRGRVFVDEASFAYADFRAGFRALVARKRPF